MASSGNFSVWNPLRVNQQTQTFAEGNLRFSSTQTSTNPAVTGTFGVTSGKWYWEIKVVAEGNASNSVGVCTTEAPLEDDSGALYNATGDAVFMYLAGGNKRTNGTSTSYGNSWTTNDIMQVALDMDNGAVYFGKNNTFQNSGNPASGSSKTGAAFTNLADKGHIQAYSLVYNNGDQVVNFGQDDTFAGRETAEGNADANGFGAFKYAPPSGYLAMCTANLPISSDIDPAQTDDDHPQKQFGVVTFTGNGSSRTISGLGFQPDLIWSKRRSGTGKRHYLVDSNRGFTKFLHSDQAVSEGTSSDGVTSATSDGFAIGGSLDYINENTSTYVAWCWRANGGTTATNTSGTITTTVQANQNAGFSILTYTGTGSNATIGHGLSAKPDFALIKRTSTEQTWGVYHSSLGATKYIALNSSSASGTDTAFWNDTEPTTSVITIGTEGRVNQSTGTYVGYVWHNVEGSSKFGVYEGNNNANGSFIYTGFKPRILFVKDMDRSENWVTFDLARDTFNTLERGLFWNADSAESTGSGSGFDIDALANGFKMRCNHDNLNGNSTYIFGAWADVPFKYNNTHP